MARTETIVSPFPAGSGRKMDYTWPDWNANSTIQIRDRPGAQAANPSGSVSPGATGTISTGVVNGVSCIRLVNANGLNTGPVCIVDGAGRLHLSTLSANMHFSNQTDDYAVTRVYAIMRVVATPIDPTDVGFEVVLGNNAGSGVLQPGAPKGWSMQFDNTGNTSLVQRGNSSALTSTPLLTAAGGFVNTDFHCFEYRFINANKQANGLVKWFIDGQLLLTRAFGSVADDLPLPSSPGANLSNGYVVNIQNQSRNGELDIAMVRLQRAPIEAALF